LFHSVLTVDPICLFLLSVGARLSRDQYIRLVTPLFGSHLLLNIVDCESVPLLYRFVKQSVGLQFPTRSVFGRVPIGVNIEN
jgi:hypothetical protein